METKEKENYKDWLDEAEEIKKFLKLEKVDTAILLMICDFLHYNQE